MRVMNAQFMVCAAASERNKLGEFKFDQSQLNQAEDLLWFQVFFDSSSLGAASLPLRAQAARMRNQLGQDSYFFLVTLPLLI